MAVAARRASPPWEDSRTLITTVVFKARPAAFDAVSARARLTREYEEAIVNPWDAAERGYVDAVIEPSQTRLQISRALRLLRTKRASLPPKKHGNIPL